MNKKNIFVLVVILILVAFAFTGFFKGEDKDTKKELTSREVALLCTTDMATEFHIHPNLTIILDGENVYIPENIGIKATCMSSIHTHEGGGVIHVEAPVKRDFTLGDFFAVWDKPFDKNSILSAVTIGESGGEVASLKVSVNGVEVDTYENTIMRDKDNIVITYTSYDEAPN